MLFRAVPTELVSSSFKAIAAQHPFDSQGLGLLERRASLNKNRRWGVKGAEAPLGPPGPLGSRGYS